MLIRLMHGGLICITKCVRLSVWVCETYVVHHLVSTGLRYAPPGRAPYILLSVSSYMNASATYSMVHLQAIASHLLAKNTDEGVLHWQMRSHQLQVASLAGPSRREDL